ncbi:MAG TPA: helix-turn-helix domain-containing protein [Pseudomonadales bacterium]|nr:helix-turn-helix domain-containing protein [Pseudomonadales bacterium]
MSEVVVMFEQLLADNNVSQQSLANALNLSPASVSNLIRGRLKVSVDMAVAIRNHFCKVACGLKYQDLHIRLIRAQNFESAKEKMDQVIRKGVLV